MKRIYAFLGILLLVALVACGGTPTPTGGNDGDKGGEKDPAKPIVPTQNIKELLKTNESLSLFTQALERTNLLDMLAGEGPFTLFAPDDNAVNKAAELERMNAAEYLEQVFVANVVKYHIVTGKKLATDFKNQDQFKTLQQYPVTIEVREDGTLFVEAAKITSPDALATNGVVHIINAVLIPLALGMDEYTLTGTGAEGTSIFGKARFSELSPTQSEVTLELANTTPGTTLPAHIHVGNVGEDGAVAYPLVSVDGATGKSTTKLDVAYDKLLEVDGYVDVHLSAEQPDIVVAGGEVGANAEPVEPGRRTKATR
ncbi:hypothetical protein BH24DEI2_BH24DEI2_23090 [soil metagenome]